MEFTFQKELNHSKINKNHILNLYFDLFIKEVEFLLHFGLIKKYNKKENNLPLTRDPGLLVN